MKRFVVFVVCLCLFSLSIAAQSGRSSRPRVVTAPSPSPSPQTDSSSSPSQPTAPRPPVLKGNTQTADQTDQTTTTEAPIEADDEVIRVETSLVSFPVSVVDRDGRFITGLQ